MLIISLAAHITLAGTFIYMPYYLSNIYRSSGKEGIIWGSVDNKSSGMGEGVSVNGESTIFKEKKTVDNDNKRVEKGRPSTDEGIKEEEQEREAKASFARDNNAANDGDDCNGLDICADRYAPGGDINNRDMNIEYLSAGSGGNNSIGNDIAGIGNGRGYGGYGEYNNTSGGYNKGDGLEGFIVSVRDEVERNKFYPRIARVNELEGTVYVNFHVDKKGRPGSVVVEKSSGYRLLDESAVSTIKKIRHFKDTPEEFMGLDITVPITYKLMRTQ